MEILKDRYTITELSQRLEITDHALRYYEKEFNLKIPKDERGRRYYSPEQANTMYQIKKMRDEGLEIKAIKKILQSEEIISDPPPVVLNEDSTSVIPINNSENTSDLIVFFDKFKDQLTSCVTAEVASAREHISKEIQRSKLELGACVENSARKIESKLEKHFNDVDKALGLWREKNKKGFFKKLF